MSRKGIRGNQGFTLVELAIVLVIIGLIVAGVLKGRELIFSSKITNLKNQAAAINAAIETFASKNKFSNPQQSSAIFTELSNAGIMAGGGTGVLKHKLGGDVFATTTGFIPGKKGVSVIFTGVPMDVAEALDKDGDDGNPTTGSILVYTDMTTLASTAPALSATGSPVADFTGTGLVTVVMYP